MKSLIQPVDVVCMREIRRRIASGYYQVGELLPSENVLAEEFGVGRSMIGKALRTLDKEGFFDVKRGVGRRVCLREFHRKHGQVGLILGNPDYLTKPSGNCLVDTIVKRLRAENLKAKIMSLRNEMGVFHHTMRSESFQNICPDEMDGLILLTQMIEMETTLELSTYCPVVWFHHTSVKPRVAGIRYNWLGGSFRAVEHLLADGRRNIGLVNIDDAFLSGREQLDGIRLALEKLPDGCRSVLSLADYLDGGHSSRRKGARWHISYFTPEDRKRIKGVMRKIGQNRFTLYEGIDRCMEACAQKIT